MAHLNNSLRLLILTKRITLCPNLIAILKIRLTQSTNQFMKKQVLLLLGVCLMSMTFANNSKPKQAHYQIIVYHLKSDAQIQQVDDYLKNAFLPALHRAGVSKAGVFKPIANDTATDKKIYIFIPMKSLEQVDQIDQSIWKDQQHLKDGAAYLNAAHNQSAFLRKETILIKAFEKMPDFAIPNLTGSTADKIYELRSYEGATEKIYRKKVEMFNEGGEVALFSRLEFNAVFYGCVLAGAQMPNLMYMTSFNNIAEREAKWKTFGSDPEWKRLSGLPEYQNTVSKADIILMHATAYSEF